MKTIILIALLAVLCFTTKAQTVKPDPKPQFSLDAKKQVPITMQFTYPIWFDFVRWTANPEAIANSPELTGAQIGVIKANAKIVTDSLISRYNAIIERERIKFTADTSKHKK